MENNLEKNTELKSQILARLEEEVVVPQSKWVYLTKEYSLWCLWFVTALLGAVSVALSLNVLSQQRFAIFELTHPSFLTFVMDVLPVLWLGVFILMIFVGILEFRQTNKGYRYPLWWVLVSSLILSLVVGTLLHIAGVGFSLDKQMGSLTNSYDSQEELEKHFWQRPDEGRLVGKAMYVREGADTEIRFIDTEGKAWELTQTELHEREKQLLAEGKILRIFGAVEAEHEFHACGVMSWVQDRSYRGKELNEIRKDTRAKIDKFKEEKMSMMASSTVCGNLMQKLPRPPRLAW